MRPVPFSWVFFLKPLDAKGKRFSHKARCCVREDLQNPCFEYNRDGLYAPAASHESIRLMFALSAASGLVVQGGDVSNAYLYGNIDVPIIIEQPTDSSGSQKPPGHVCPLTKSTYCLETSW